jgi:hypothetical protein
VTGPEVGVEHALRHPQAVRPRAEAEVAAGQRRPDPTQRARIAAARRKAMTQKFARLAALRLAAASGQLDPAAAFTTF